MRLFQISDTHFGTEVPAVVDALVHAIEALQPQVLLLCGDITQRARPAQFAAARRFLERLPPTVEVLAIPGNHDLPLFDLWARLRRPYAAFVRSFGAREHLWCREGVAIVALDATHPRRHKDGALPAAHLRERLAAARAACGAAGRLVVAAHQPLWTTWAKDQSETLIGRHESARLLAEARADVVLSGHVHVPLIDTSAASDPQLPWHFVLSGSGTAVSHRTRAGVPNSFNLLELPGAAEGMLQVERHDFDGTRFARAEALRLARGPRGWTRQDLA